MNLEYILKLTDKFSAVFNQFDKLVKQSETAFGKLERKMQGFNELVTSVGNVTSALDGMIQKTASLSDTMAIVQKNTGLSAAEMQGLRAAIDGMNTRTATEDLLKMASVGGKLGVPREDLEGFVKVIDKATVALGDEFGGSAEAVATVLGKIKGQYKEFSQIGFGEALQGIGSAINYLGKQGANSAPNVAEFTQRVSTLGLSLAQATGLGATLEELGLSAEIASGGLKAVYGLAGTNADKFAKVVGMTTKEFENLVNTSPNDVILRLAQSLQGASSTQIDQTLKMLGIGSQEASQVVKLLAENTDRLTKRQSQAAFALANKNDLDNEAALMQNTLGAQIDRVKKAFDGYATAIGTALGPTLPYINAAGMLAFSISQLLPLIAFMQTNLLAATAAVGRFVVSTGVAAVRALAGFATGLLMAAGQGLRGLLIGLGAATRSQWLFNVALSANPIGLAVAALAALAAAIVYAYNRFEWFRNMVGVAGEAVKAVFRGIYNVMMGVVEGVKSLLRYVGLLSNQADEAAQKAAERATTTINRLPKPGEKLFTLMGVGFKAPGMEEVRKAEAIKKANQSRLSGLLAGQGAGGAVPGVGVATSSAPVAERALADVSGGGAKETNVNITVGKLNEKIEIITNHLGQSADEIESILMQLMMRVVNSANQA